MQNIFFLGPTTSATTVAHAEGIADIEMHSIDTAAGVEHLPVDAVIWEVAGARGTAERDAIIAAAAMRGIDVVDRTRG